MNGLVLNVSVTTAGLAQARQTASNCRRCDMATNMYFSSFQLFVTSLCLFLEVLRESQGTDYTICCTDNLYIEECTLMHVTSLNNSCSRIYFKCHLKASFKIVCLVGLYSTSNYKSCKYIRNRLDVASMHLLLNRYPASMHQRPAGSI